MRDRVGVLVAALVAATVIGAVLVIRLSATRQPIAYNHKKHIDAGLECSTCHIGVAQGQARAQIPTIDVCLGCHASDDNPRTQPIRDYAEKKRPIPWRQVYRLPAHVYFSHRRHVASAGLDCATCHGNMKAREKPVTRQVLPIDMARCVDCHRSRGVTTDCLACHK